MDLQNKRIKKRKETPEQREYWDTLEKIILSVQGWGLIIMWYVPKLIEIGINKKDIKAHFKELVEAYEGEKIYNCEKVDREA